ncbi:hypothetical protein QF034_008171 [Streptomyces africanus]|uniref:Uncharacterized protein n=1 Tax=Streptomyces africanus TaxID=231024 RepID=A0ABU0R3P9_9ACTN|nr:hypothetical protein [Streptomyces africanus]MDQ0753940.1 hypothetical protein [Streptomyces africanus]
MTTDYRRRRVVCVTGVLMLALAAPTTADAVSAESQPSRGSTRAPATCATATTGVPIAPGYEGLYTHYADMMSGCSVVKNVGSLPLQFWSDNGSLIDAPVHSATPEGWAAETTAQQIKRWIPPGRVVVLPGESAVMYQPPPSYTVDVVPVHVARQAEFAAQYTRLAQAAYDAGQSVPLNNRLGISINDCAEAASDTLNELGQGTGVESLADTFDRAKGFNSCKKAYDIIDPSSASPDKPPGWERWRQRATGFNVEWNKQLTEKIVARAARILGTVR